MVEVLQLADNIDQQKKRCKRRDAMSKELDRLEKRATQKFVTDHEDIDRIIRYLFSLPFTAFTRYSPGYDCLRNDLCKGFNISMDRKTNISMEDVLILIGYEPGTPFFDPPDRGKMGFTKSFNAAGHSYIFADLIVSLSHNDIHIKEFTKIGLNAYTDYITEKVKAEYRDKLIPYTAHSNILNKVDEFRRASVEYVQGDQKTGHDECTITLGELIGQALSRSRRRWNCADVLLDEYCAETIGSYVMLNRFIMDSLRMPLIRSDRERFQEIITKYRNIPVEYPVRIDYEKCFEHGGIILK